QGPNPSNGALTLNSDGTFTYVPALHHIGDDTFTYKVYDGVAYSDPVTDTIHVTDIAPVAYNSAYYNVPAGQALNVGAPGVLSAAHDADDPMTAVPASGPSHAASFTLNADGSFSYTPAGGFTGLDTFRYKANDTVLDSTPVTVSLYVGTSTQATATDV